MLMPDKSAYSQIKNNSLKGSRPIQVIAVTSGKGGVGKTNVSANLATAMVANGKKVILLDADMGLANIDVMLGLKPKYNLSDVISGEKTLQEVMVTTPTGLQIIPAASGIKLMTELSPMQHAGLIRAFSDITTDLDALLVDTAAGISDTVISFCQASQEIIVVVCDEPTSIVDSFALIKVLSRDHGVSHFHILSNMTQSNQEGRELFMKLLNVADKYLDITTSYLGTIPYDDCLRKAVKKQKVVVEAFPRSRASIAFKNLALKTGKWPQVDSPGGHVEFFVERLIGSKTNISESR